MIRSPGPESFRKAVGGGVPDAAQLMGRRPCFNEGPEILCADLLSSVLGITNSRVWALFRPRLVVESLGLDERRGRS